MPFGESLVLPSFTAAVSLASHASLLQCACSISDSDFFDSCDVEDCSLLRSSIVTGHIIVGPQSFSPQDIRVVKYMEPQRSSV